jgi:ABC-type multidrug transport system permease subunit
MKLDPKDFEVVLTESIFGLVVMGITIIFNTYSFTWITLAYRQTLSKTAPHGKHFEILRFVWFNILLVIAMLMSLSIWVIALTAFDFVTHWTVALLFSASFFTTVGNFTINLPHGWRLIPSIVAFSGLFAFAWAGAASMSMVHHLSDYLEKRKHH